MGEYFQELQDVADARKRLPGLLTAIIILQVLTLLAIAALTWVVALMAATMSCT
jgi:flagellar basal body-associated protein FliL